MGLTLCNTNEFVQSQFSDGFLNCTVYVVVAATADIAADVAATCGDRERRGGGIVVVFVPPHQPTSMTLSSNGKGRCGCFLNDALPLTTMTSTTSWGGRPPTPPIVTLSLSLSLTSSTSES